ncbi:hypothetical protein DERP_013291 [Dermatophagoides pteronyssinus]|uniref:Uncharacterized protein n=1 Tax=Dermatophagoides pteronyssinus TaxID=6956 RepID=A0ABQ8J3J9_DERPT|nr:hypothetical protein DERP_013291 [Dermatophagoides pteronyssinus]
MIDNNGTKMTTMATNKLQIDDDDNGDVRLFHQMIIDTPTTTNVLFNYHSVNSDGCHRRHRSQLPLSSSSLNECSQHGNMMAKCSHQLITSRRHWSSQQQSSSMMALSSSSSPNGHYNGESHSLRHHRDIVHVHSFDSFNTSLIENHIVFRFISSSGGGPCFDIGPCGL